MEQNNWSELSIPNNEQYLPVALKYIELETLLDGFDRDSINEILAASKEAIDNVFKHAFKPEENVHFQIITKHIPLGIIITVKDKGMPFDPKFIPVQIKKNDTKIKTGLYKMKKNVDSVEYHNLGSQGKELHLIKHLHRNHISNIDKDKTIKFEDPSPHIDNTAEQRVIYKFTVRIIKDNEVIETSKAIYNTYGYTYLSEDMYYPERILKLIKTGQLVPVIAITEDNRTAGYCSLQIEDDNKKIAELGQAVVSPEFRGHHCFTRMNDFFLDYAEKNNLYSLFVQAVTNHIFSQKGAEKLGAKESAILLGYCPESLSFKKFEEQSHQRISVLVSFLILKKKSNDKVYLNENYSDIIKKIYVNLELEVEFISMYDILDKEKEFPEHTLSEIKVKQKANFAKIIIKNIGKDFPEVLLAARRKLCLQHIDVIYLHISLNSPRSPFVLSEIEKCGFFFAGVIPFESIGDSLVFQYLNNIEIDFKQIRLYTDFAKSLLSYIDNHKNTI